MNFLRKKIDVMLLSLFGIASVLLYIFITGDNLSSILKFIMFIFLLFAMHFTIKYKDKSGLVYAILFTVMSDSILVTNESISELSRTLAMITFSIAQIFHMLFLNKEVNEKTRNIFYLIRISIFLTCYMIILIFKIEVTTLVIVCSFYFSMLVMNFIESLFNCKNHYIVTIGYGCFIMCDIFVGINTGISIGILSIGESYFMDLFSRISKIDWIFYLISQYMFVLFILINTKYKSIKNNL